MHNPIAAAWRCRRCKGERLPSPGLSNSWGKHAACLSKQGQPCWICPALVIGPPDEWGPLDDALAELEEFHWLVVSSSNGVDAVEQRLQRLGGSLARRPRSLKIAAVGRKTAARLEALGAPADFVPPQFVADSLIDHFPVSGWGLRLLLPRVQSGGRTVLAEAFGEAGARVVEVAAYESRCPAALPAATAAALAAGAWMRSPSAVAKRCSTPLNCWNSSSVPPGSNSWRGWRWCRSGRKQATPAATCWGAWMPRLFPTTWMAWWRACVQALNNQPLKA